MTVKMMTRLVCVLFLALVTNSYAQSNAECLECHSDPELAKEPDSTGKTISLFVDEDLFGESIHGGFECIDCHSDIEDAIHEDDLQKVNCGDCHDDAVEAIAASVHGEFANGQSPDLPGCARCHGTHNILPKDDPNSLVSRMNQPNTCGQCHANPEVIARNNFAIKSAVAMYEKSIHGELALSGSADAATCSDCHGGHNTLYHLNEKSSIYKLNISKTCGQCHESEKDEYLMSVHGTSLLEGAKDSPTCIDCHGEHDVLRPDNPDSRTSGFNVAVDVCSPCHASERMAAKYGLNAARVKTYKDSYHGLASRGGKAAVANCGSCHGVHNILPSSDPRSLINASNLASTCGTCHPNASENFTRGKIHLVEGENETVIMGYVEAFYISMIVVIIGFMIIHNGFDLAAKIRHIRAEKYHAK